MQDKLEIKMRVGSLVRFRSHPDLGIILAFKKGAFNKNLLAEVKFLTNSGGNIDNVKQGTFLLSQEGLEVICK